MALAWGALGIAFAALGVLVIFIALDAGESSGRDTYLAGAGIIVLALVLLGSILAVVLDSRRRWRTRRAAAEMALGRGWHYEIEVDPRLLRGSLFRSGTYARVENAMHVHEPQFVEVGNHTFRADQGRSTKGVEQIGYVRVLLDRALPHLHLEAQGRARPRPYAIGFDRTQILDLEGDFRRYWRVFVPRGYEPDAYYVFTPDFMQTLVDGVPGSDVEIIDAELFVYAPGPFDLTSPRTLEAAQAIAAVVGEHAARRAERYADERSGRDGVVAEAGARLSPARDWALRIVPAAIAGIVLLVIGWQSGALGG